jgi:hypothetical protein
MLMHLRSFSNSQQKLQSNQLSAIGISASLLSYNNTVLTRAGCYVRRKEALLAHSTEWTIALPLQPLWAPLMGALHGTLRTAVARGIPAAWRTAVLGSTSYTSGGGSIRRPQWLALAQAPGLIEQLMALPQQAPALPSV